MKERFRPILKPDDIYQRSFSMIEEEIGEHTFTEKQWPVVRRVIHATADFELGKSLLFHPKAVDAGRRAIGEGKGVVVDVRMVQAGVENERLLRWGNRITCRIGEEKAGKIARREGITRSMAAMRLAAGAAQGAVVVVGNAPTALIELVRLVREDRLRPALIVGLPVGFVSVTESKEMLWSLREIPTITNRGRKGGSSAASAVVNALASMVDSPAVR
ncbi:precorrin-8X methylmutase [Paludifilum halophilum]|uniref:Precorrin-8X methylmutase n=1 Tax=Paludifilum halophilum TaxID=1642702 RepID=A0A235B9Y0_9BACL|nr:precorrin-8X methylmutase [Paludifilum halophilum]OYD08809.1 precorrin-8X methylmutase [Paludifilum halophilum]